VSKESGIFTVTFSSVFPFFTTTKLISQTFFSLSNVHPDMFCRQIVRMFVRTQSSTIPKFFLIPPWREMLNCILFHFFSLRRLVSCCF
jgi:hypothetical protein